MLINIYDGFIRSELSITETSNRQLFGVSQVQIVAQMGAQEPVGRPPLSARVFSDLPIQAAQ